MVARRAFGVDMSFINSARVAVDVDEAGSDEGVAEVEHFADDAAESFPLARVFYHTVRDCERSARNDTVVQDDRAEERIILCCVIFHQYPTVSRHSMGFAISSLT